MKRLNSLIIFWRNISGDFESRHIHGFVSNGYPVGNLFNSYTLYGVLLGVYKMKYGLKDKKLHETLDQISNGDFSKRLEEHDVTPRGLIWFGEDEKFAIDTDYFEFEKVFDPNDWNEYPKITPPEPLILILKEIYCDGRVRYYVVKCKDGWLYTIDSDGSERRVGTGDVECFVKGLPL